jgi:hypothetical protein
MMARESRMQNPVHPVINTMEDQRKYDMPTYRRLGVYAEPVNMYVSPAASDAAKLAEALSSSGLTQAFDRNYKEAREAETVQGASKAMKDGLQGAEDADAKARAEKSLGFYEGYMKLQGSLAYQEDAEQLKRDWNAAPKDGTSFDAWAKEWWKKKGAGVQDKSYLEGYTPGMAKAIGDLKQEVLKTDTANLAAKLNVDAMDHVASTFKQADTVTPLTWATMKKDIEFFYGKKDADDLLHATAERAAAKGDYELVEKITALYDQKTPDDNVPALARFSDKKEALVLKAHSMYQRMSKAEKDATKVKLEQEFDDKFSAGFASVLSGDMKLEDFMAGVNEHFKDHPQIGIKAMAELQGVIMRAGKREETADQERNFNDLLIQLHEGKANKNTFLEAERNGLVTGRQVSQLLREQDGIRARDRQIGTQNNAIRKQERAELKATYGQSFVSSLPPETMFENSGEALVRYRQKVANLRLDFSRQLDDALDKGGDAPYALLDTYQKKAVDAYKEATGTLNDQWKNYKPKYSLEEAKRLSGKAVSEGGRVDPQVKMDADYYIWISKGGGAK